MCLCVSSSVEVPIQVCPRFLVCLEAHVSLPSDFCDVCCNRGLRVFQHRLQSFFFPESFQGQVLFRLTFFLPNIYVLFLWHVLFHRKHTDLGVLPRVTPWNFSYSREMLWDLKCAIYRTNCPSHWLLVAPPPPMLRRLLVLRKSLSCVCEEFQWPRKQEENSDKAISLSLGYLSV